MYLVSRVSARIAAHAHFVKLSLRLVLISHVHRGKYVYTAGTAYDDLVIILTV